MAQEREIAARLASLGELGNIVSVIRAIAASQMQQALRSLEAIDHYAAAIREALSEAATLLPARNAGAVPRAPSRAGLILFSSEHGLCGGFNERLLQAAEQARQENAPGGVLIVVGSRGGRICRERAINPDLLIPAATHCAGVTAAARRIAAEAYRMLTEQRVTRLEIIYARHAGGQTIRIERRRLLPLELPSDARRVPDLPPLINLEPRRLFEELVGEYFFATLEDAAMQSFCSENSSRFHAMEAAHQNIGKKQENLSKLSRRLFQESVTTEILDLISGTQALMG